MSEPIGDFEGITEESQSFGDTIMHHATHLYKKAIALTKDSEKKESVDSRDHELHFLYNKVMADGSSESMLALEKEIEHRQFIDRLFQQFPDNANAPEQPQDFDYLRLMVGGVEDMCGEWSSYSLKYVAKLANACDSKTNEELGQMYAKIGQFCGAI